LTKLKSVVLIAGAAAFLFGRMFYVEVGKNTQEKENMTVVPKVDSSSVAEIGYVFEARNEIDYSDRIRKAMWWVKVPTTNKRYSCSWEGGFRGFEESDGVQIIHKLGGPHEVTWDGYIIGLHGKKQGRVALVWALDVDDIEMDQ
jgi:hypothetical protein